MEAMSAPSPKLIIIYMAMKNKVFLDNFLAMITLLCSLEK